MELRLLHTADVHLGCSSRAFGERAEEHRRRIAQAFGRCVDEALRQQVQIFLIAGDLFDRQQPGRHALQTALEQLRRLAEASPPIEMVILPGTRSHDAWGPRSVWQTPELRELPPRVHLLAEGDPPRVELPQLGVLLQGRPPSADGSRYEPLARLVADPAFAFNVGLCHASLERGDIPADGETSTIGESQIAATGLDYLALGHWHNPAEPLHYGEVAACYSGSPEILTVDQTSPGRALLVTLREGQPPEIEPIPTGSLAGRAEEVDLTELTSAAELATRLAAFADGNLILTAKLRGLAALGLELDLDRLQEDLADRFFRLQLTDESHVALEQISAGDFPEQQVSGVFVRLARERIEAARASGDERQLHLAERALQVGLAALRSGEVPL